ncbi:MAG: Crp/Fnr family transcriptional regulator, partial [Deltaproteobacteria bacterium]|nr:Crp/Fnr family transcriptional regulator [Deltaproteobacteria bacterium]
MTLSKIFPVIQGELEKEFLKYAAMMEYKAGERLYEEGFPCPFVPFIISGEIRVFKIGESGREITLYRVKEGDVCILSSSCSVSQKQYPAIAEAGKLTTAYVVPGKIFGNMMRKYPELHDMIFNLLSDRLIELMGVVEEIKLTRVESRIANRLLDLTTPPGPQDVNITHAQLAIDLGSAREVISRTLKKLEREGGVSLVRGKIMVTSREV